MKPCGRAGGEDAGRQPTVTAYLEQAWFPTAEKTALESAATGNVCYAMQQLSPDRSEFRRETSDFVVSPGSASAMVMPEGIHSQIEGTNGHRTGD